MYPPRLFEEFPRETPKQRKRQAILSKSTADSKVVLSVRLPQLLAFPAQCLSYDLGQAESTDRWDSPRSSAQRSKGHAHSGTKVRGHARSQDFRSAEALRA